MGRGCGVPGTMTGMGFNPSPSNSGGRLGTGMGPSAAHPRRCPCDRVGRAGDGLVPSLSQMVRRYWTGTGRASLGPEMDSPNGGESGHFGPAENDRGAATPIAGQYRPYLKHQTHVTSI
eukprot:jgi/Botrbrau1/351/Bobra.110_2s0010.1